MCGPIRISGFPPSPILFDGEIMQSATAWARSRPSSRAKVNWMTAGRGITHSERFEKARAQGDSLHGIQAWVALPNAAEESEPSFAHHGIEDLPTYESGGLWARLVAGEALRRQSQVKTHSPLFYVHWRLATGADAQMPAEYSERAAYLVSGAVEVEGRVYEAGHMLVFRGGRSGHVHREGGMQR